MSHDRIHIRATWKRFRQVVGLLLKSKEHGRKARICAASMVGLILATNGLIHDEVLKVLRKGV